MPKNVGSLILKLVLASFVVGFILNWMGITPVELFHDVVNTVRTIWGKALDIASWGIDYVILGAVVVVPIWAVVFVINYLKGKGGRIGAGTASNGSRAGASRSGGAEGRENRGARSGSSSGHADRNRGDDASM